MTEQEVIATVLVNQRLVRNGGQPTPYVLDMLNNYRRDEFWKMPRQLSTP